MNKGKQIVLLKNKGALIFLQVFAVNTEDENGEKTIKNKKAPAGGMKR